tara:strand:- start:690 stop:929 length:240 start_codon:yes stop_codon:yes gene_type:complete
MKPGIKTSEMIITLIGMIGGVVLASIEGNQWTQIIGGILAAVCGGSYTMGRSMVKGKEAIGAAQVQAARELAKKQDPKS